MYTGSRIIWYNRQIIGKKLPFYALLDSKCRPKKSITSDQSVEKSGNCGFIRNENFNPKFRFLTKNFNFSPKFRLLTKTFWPKIYIFDQKILSKLRFPTKMPINWNSNQKFPFSRTNFFIEFFPQIYKTVFRILKEIDSWPKEKVLKEYENKLVVKEYGWVGMYWMVIGIIIGITLCIVYISCTGLKSRRPGP